MARIKRNILGRLDVEKVEKIGEEAVPLLPEESVSEYCKNTPCVHGNCVLKTIGPPYCKCDPGFGGELCDTKLNKMDKQVIVTLSMQSARTMEILVISILAGMAAIAVGVAIYCYVSSKRRKIVDVERYSVYGQNNSAYVGNSNSNKLDMRVFPKQRMGCYVGCCCPCCAKKAGDADFDELSSPNLLVNMPGKGKKKKRKRKKKKKVRKGSASTGSGTTASVKKNKLNPNKNMSYSGNHNYNYMRVKRRVPTSDRLHTSRYVQYVRGKSQVPTYRLKPHYRDGSTRNESTRRCLQRHDHSHRQSRDHSHNYRPDDYKYFQAQRQRVERRHPQQRDRGDVYNVDRRHGTHRSTSRSRRKPDGYVHRHSREQVYYHGYSPHRDGYGRLNVSQNHNSEDNKGDVLYKHNSFTEMSPLHRHRVKSVHEQRSHSSENDRQISKDSVNPVGSSHASLNSCSSQSDEQVVVLKENECLHERQAPKLKQCLPSRMNMSRGREIPSERCNSNSKQTIGQRLMNFITATKNKTKTGVARRFQFNKSRKASKEHTPLLTCTSSETEDESTNQEDDTAQQNSLSSDSESADSDENLTTTSESETESHNGSTKSSPALLTPNAVDDGHYRKLSSLRYRTHDLPPATIQDIKRWRDLATRKWCSDQIHFLKKRNDVHVSFGQNKQHVFESDSGHMICKSRLCADNLDLKTKENLRKCAFENRRRREKLADRTYYSKRTSLTPGTPRVPQNISSACDSNARERVVSTEALDSPDRLLQKPCPRNMVSSSQGKQSKEATHLKCTLSCTGESQSLVCKDTQGRIPQYIPPIEKVRTCCSKSQLRSVAQDSYTYSLETALDKNNKHIATQEQDKACSYPNFPQHYFDPKRRNNPSRIPFKEGSSGRCTSSGDAFQSSIRPIESQFHQSRFFKPKPLMQHPASLEAHRISLTTRRPLPVTKTPESFTGHKHGETHAGENHKHYDNSDCYFSSSNGGRFELNRNNSSRLTIDNSNTVQYCCSLDEHEDYYDQREDKDCARPTVKGEPVNCEIHSGDISVSILSSQKAKRTGNFETCCHSDSGVSFSSHQPDNNEDYGPETHVVQGSASPDARQSKSQKIQCQCRASNLQSLDFESFNRSEINFGKTGARFPANDQTHFLPVYSEISSYLSSVKESHLSELSNTETLDNPKSCYIKKPHAFLIENCKLEHSRNRQQCAAELISRDCTNVRRSFDIKLVKKRYVVPETDASRKHKKPVRRTLFQTKFKNCNSRKCRCIPNVSNAENYSSGSESCTSMCTVQFDGI